MNNIYQFTKKIMYENKKDYRYIMTAIIIAVFLITVIFNIGYFLVETQRNNEILEAGNVHILIKSFNYNDLNDISLEEEIKHSGYVKTIDSNANFKINNKLVNIMAISEDIIDNFSIKILQGSYPVLHNEIMINESLAIDNNFDIDDEITLINEGFLNVYKVSAIVEDKSYIKVTNINEIYFKPSFFDVYFQYYDDYQERFMIEIQKIKNIESIETKLIYKYNIEQEDIIRNDFLILLDGILQNNINFQNNIINNIVMVMLFISSLVIFAAILMIISGFSINFLKKIKFYGLLKCLGMTNNQLKMIISVECFLLSIKGIFLGLLYATLSSWIIFYFLQKISNLFVSNNIFKIYPIPVLIAIFTGFIIIFLANLKTYCMIVRVTPLESFKNEAVNNNFGLKKIYNNSKGSIFFRIGVGNATKTLKNYIINVISLSFTIILFLTFTPLLHFFSNANTAIEIWQPDLSIYEPNYSLSVYEGLVEKIRENTGVKSVYGRQYMEDVQVKINGELYNAFIESYDINQIKWINKEVIEESDKQDRLELNEAYIKYNPSIGIKVEDKITLSNYDVDLLVKKIVSKNISNNKSDVNIIVNKKTFDKIFYNSKYTVIDIQLYDHVDESSIFDIRERVTGNYIVSDYRKINFEIKSLNFIVNFCIWSFLVVIGFVSIISIVNVLRFSIESKKKQYKLMNKIGMTSKQQNKILKLEVLSYFIPSEILGITVGVIINRFIHNTLIFKYWGIVWRFPTMQVMILIIGTITVVYLTVMYTEKNIHY